MALFGLDLAWSISTVETMATAATVLEFFVGDYTLRIGVDLAGLAIAGAFLVMPSFTAIQTWVQENRRARVIAGVPVYFYPSPLHYRIIPELVYGSNATIIFGTDTFLSGYARTAHLYDFRFIRYCLSVLRNRLKAK